MKIATIFFFSLSFLIACQPPNSTPGQNFSLPDRLLMLSDRNGQSTAYTLDPETSEVQALFAEQALLFPQISNALQWVFVTDEADHQRLRIQAFPPAQTSAYSLVTAHQIAFPRWSVQGTQLVFQQKQDDITSIWTWEASRKTLQQISPVGQVSLYPQWSPDGQHLLYLQQHRNAQGLRWEIHRYDQEIQQSQLLTPDDASDYNASWSSDGQQIVFTSQDAKGWNLYTMRSDGSERRAWTSEHQEVLSPVWSVDGQFLAYIIKGQWKETDNGGTPAQDTLNQLMLLELSTGNTRQIAMGIGYRNPQWSRNGQRIYFEASSGNREIYSVQTDGTQLRNLTRHAAQDRLMQVW